MIFIVSYIKKKLSHTNSPSIYSTNVFQASRHLRYWVQPLYIISRIFAIQIFKHWNRYYSGPFDFDLGSCKFEYFTDAQLQFGWI